MVEKKDRVIIKLLRLRIFSICFSSFIKIVFGLVMMVVRIH